METGKIGTLKLHFKNNCSFRTQKLFVFFPSRKLTKQTNKPKNKCERVSKTQRTCKLGSGLVLFICELCPFKEAPVLAGSRSELHTHRNGLPADTGQQRGRLTDSGNTHLTEDTARSHKYIQLQIIMHLSWGPSLYFFECIILNCSLTFFYVTYVLNILFPL